MAKVECSLTDILEKTYDKLDQGLLLSSVGSDGGKNVMAIGWGLVGVLWGEPVFMVAVRHSRHTHKLIEETNEFTVNIPSDDMEEVIAYCGKVSGREHDKFKEMKLTTQRGRIVKSPTISECVAHYECRVIGKSEVVPENLSKDVLRTCYAGGDYHTLYFGKILLTYMDNRILH